MTKTDFGESDIPDSDSVGLKSVVAEQVRFALGWRLPATWSIDVKQFDYGNRIGVAFNMFLLGCEIRRNIEKRESIPDSLWSHILLRFPWLRRIFGAPRMREIQTEVKHWHVCPHIRTDPHNQHVTFLVKEKLSP